ncbi:MAG: TlpA disulfide reductase family protein [Chloroflexota bacterium]
MRTPFQLRPYLLIGLMLALTACAPQTETVLVDSQIETAADDPQVINPVQSPPVDETAEAAELAHDFSLPTLDGGVLTLSEQKGEWVLVNFWATWCVYCVDEMPYLQEVADRGDIQVWGINMRETVDEMNTFVEEHNISFPILLSPDNDTILAYPGGMPRTFIIGPDGTVAHTLFGPIDPEQFDVWLADNVVNQNS